MQPTNAFFLASILLLVPLAFVKGEENNSTVAESSGATAEPVVLNAIVLTSEAVVVQDNETVTDAASDAVQSSTDSQIVPGSSSEDVSAAAADVSTNGDVSAIGDDVTSEAPKEDVDEHELQHVVSGEESDDGVSSSGSVSSLVMALVMVVFLALFQ